MKSTSKILYRIGQVFNIISILLLAFFIFAFAYGMANSESVYEEIAKQGSVEYTVDEFHKFCTVGLITVIIAAVIDIVVFIIAHKAIKALDKPGVQLGYHVTMIVIGILGGDLFYLIGAIVGLVAESSQG